MADPVNRPAPVPRPGSRAAVRQSNAEAKKAAAEAQRIEAEAKLRKVEAESKAAERAAERQAQGRSPMERFYQAGLNVAAATGGVVGGYKIAGGIEKRHVASLKANAKQVKALGGQANRLLHSKMPRGLMLAKLKGVVSTADKMGLTKLKGPLGIAPAAVMVAEGLVSRFVLPRSIESEAAREVVGSVGTASLFAGGSLLYKRSVYNATLKNLPQAKSFAAIQAARAKLNVTVSGQVAAKTHAPIVQATARASKAAASSAGVASQATSRALSVAGKAIGVAGKVALPLQAGLTAYEAYRGYQKEGVKGALIGAGDSLTFGAVSAIRKLVNSGGGQSGGDNRLVLAQRAAGRLAFEERSARLRSMARHPKKSTGWTKAYYRVQAGRTTRVSGYKTPMRSFR